MPTVLPLIHLEQGKLILRYDIFVFISFLQFHIVSKSSFFNFSHTQVESRNGMYQNLLNAG